MFLAEAQWTGVVARTICTGRDRSRRTCHSPPRQRGPMSPRRCGSDAALVRGQGPVAASWPEVLAPPIRNNTCVVLARIEKMQQGVSRRRGPPTTPFSINGQRVTCLTPLKLPAGDAVVAPERPPRTAESGGGADKAGCGLGGTAAAFSWRGWMAYVRM